jgi:hypothetical protein
MEYREILFSLSRSLSLSPPPPPAAISGKMCGDKKERKVKRDATSAKLKKESKMKKKESKMEKKRREK